MLENEYLENILWKYFEGKTSDDEKKKISDWLDESRKNHKLFSVMKKAYIEIEADAIQDDTNVEKAYQRFVEYIYSDRSNKEVVKDTRVFIRTALIRYASVAAIVVFVGMASFFIGRKLILSSNYKQNIVEVPYGGRSSIILPDGSKVWLNAGSKLIYSNNYGIKSRDVRLDGEAFFDVEKSKKTFVVHTSHLDIKVLGTSFNVRSYSDDQEIEATLVEGNIRIERKEVDKPLFLKPNERFIYRKTDHVVEIKKTHSEAGNNKETGKSIADKEETNKNIHIYRNVNTDEAVSWREGTLILNNEPLGKLTRRLSRKYDISFKFEDERLKSYSYTGTLGNIPLEQVLEAMELTSPVHCKISEKTVWLSYNKDFTPITLNEDVTD